MDRLDGTRRRRSGGTFSQKLKHNPGQALIEADEIIRLAPDNANGWCLKGMALLQLDRNEEGLHSFGQAIRLRPDMTEAWQGKGICLVRLGRFEEALGALARAPRVYLVCHERGRALAGLGRCNEAMDALQEAIRLNPDDKDILDSSRSLLDSLARRRQGPVPAEPKAADPRAADPRAADPHTYNSPA